MASIAEVMDFLMHLMRDDKAQHEFDRDPDAALAHHGLSDVTAQDVSDACLMMADSGAVRPRAGAERPAHGGGSGHDPIHEINYTTNHFEVGDITTTVISVEDNDTLIVDSFNDSFNNDVKAIQDNRSTDVDVISIVDNDSDGNDDGPEGNQEDEPGTQPPDGTEPGDEPSDGAGPGTEPVGGGADPGAVVGAAPGVGDVPGDGEPIFGGEPGDGDDQVSVDDFGTDTTNSGAGEGFAPGEDSGFGVRHELGTEAGLTPDAGESFDEL